MLQLAAVNLTTAAACLLETVNASLAHAHILSNSGYNEQETAKVIKEQDWTIALTRRGSISIKGKGKMVLVSPSMPPKHLFCL
jgi:hypothetical protein